MSDQSRHRVSDVITIPNFIDLLNVLDPALNVAAHQNLVPIDYYIDEFQGPIGPIDRIAPGCDDTLFVPNSFQLTCIFVVENVPKLDNLISKLKLSTPGQYRAKHSSNGGYYEIINVKAIFEREKSTRKIGFYKTSIYDIVAKAKLSIHPEYTWKNIRLSKLIIRFPDY
jgi:hypothetical protein